MAGSLNSDSVIWVVGDTTGKDVYGDTVPVPVNEDFSASGTTAGVQSELDRLEAKLAASGILYF